MDALAKVAITKKEPSQETGQAQAAALTQATADGRLVQALAAAMHDSPELHKESPASSPSDPVEEELFHEHQPPKEELSSPTHDEEMPEVLDNVELHVHEEGVFEWQPAFTTS